MMAEAFLVAIFTNNVFINAEPALPTYGVACERILKNLGVEPRYIGKSTHPFLHWFSADETKPFTCIPMQPIAGVL